MATKKSAKAAKKAPAIKPAAKKPAAKNSAAKKPAAKKQTKPFSTKNAAEAFQHFLPAAEKLPSDDVQIRGGDTAVARKNTERGLEAVRPYLAKLPGILPKISVKSLLELPALALALVHADGRVGTAASSGEIDAAMARVSQLRDLSLTFLEIAAGLDLVPEDRVRRIRSGKGKLDNARDCVDIAGVFREYESALAGKHPFSPEQLNELATTGTWLVERITPRGTAKQPNARDPNALLRDRFWKLLEDGHNDLRTAGVALFGIKRVDELVPPLLSRSSPRKEEPKQTAGETPSTSPP